MNPYIKTEIYLDGLSRYGCCGHFLEVFCLLDIVEDDYVKSSLATIADGEYEWFGEKVSRMMMAACAMLVITSIKIRKTVSRRTTWKKQESAS